MRRVQSLFSRFTKASSGPWPAETAAIVHRWPDDMLTGYRSRTPTSHSTAYSKVTLAHGTAAVGLAHRPLHIELA